MSDGAVVIAILLFLILVTLLGGGGIVLWGLGILAAFGLLVLLRHSEGAREVAKFFGALAMLAGVVVVWVAMKS